MDFREYLQNNTVYLDGGMGTLLQSKGLCAGELPEWWNVTHSDEIISVHKAYFDAGSNVVNTNTFGANILKFNENELEQIVSCAIKNAKTARDMSVSCAPKFISLDIGPLGKLLKPYGTLDFEEAVGIFAKTVKIAVKYGVDVVTIETMNDSYETKAAVLAVKENCELPVIVTNAYGDDGKLMTGASPEAMSAMLEGLGVDAIGVNCSLGPAQLVGVVDRLLEVSSVPIVVKPNAGLPQSVNGETVYNVKADEFSDYMIDFVKKGVRVVGGCCGTTPEFIEKTFAKTHEIEITNITDKQLTVVSSYTNVVKFDIKPVLIGERINPTGKKRFKQALLENDIGYILQEGISQQEHGVDILDVNVGLPDIDEKSVLTNAVCELQAVVDLPLQIDTSDAVAMESALRVYNGKALINSVNGKMESMNSIFPLVKKYGGVVVALTLDENGIPGTVEGRVAIAEKIIDVAEKYGIAKNDIIFDTLAMTVSADDNSANITIGALDIIKNKMGCHTSLGVSNVSFGLPSRDVINSTFFSMALAKGLSAAIMNPYSLEMMKVYHSFCALSGLDKNCSSYIDFCSNNSFDVALAPNVLVKEQEHSGSDLFNAIVKGLKDSAAELTVKAVEYKAPLDIVNEDIIPALDHIGCGFEKKTVFLPQLLMSAEASKCAFEVIKEKMASENDEQALKGPIVIATVKGDIHDIGKNIVKLLLENYGFEVIDLGKDVSPETIVDAVVSHNAPICALSALMTTTVPAMEQTIKLIHSTVPGCKTVVGGAVLNLEYAKMIGADKYASDAMETVRYAEQVIV